MGGLTVCSSHIAIFYYKSSSCYKSTLQSKLKTKHKIPVLKYKYLYTVSSCENMSLPNPISKWHVFGCSTFNIILIGCIWNLIKDITLCTITPSGSS